MKIIIAGDFASRGRISKQIDERLFANTFPAELRTIIESADYSIVNFESPVIDKGYEPIFKCGPNLGCSQESVNAIRYAGFNCVTLANNHILDFGAKGLYKTLECCETKGINAVGVGDNLEKAGEVLYLDNGGESLAVINCCEQEFSIATETEPGANPLNPIRQYYAIQQAKVKANHILVVVHGGHEYFQLPSPRMQQTYRFFIDAGADAVINHHQHCYSGFEIYKGKPVFYGLGNFCFDGLNTSPDSWYEGYLVQLEFNNECVTPILYPYVQCRNEASIQLLKDRTEFDNKISELNEIISDSRKLHKAVEEYYLSATQTISALYQPYENRIFNKLYRLHILPALVSRRKFAQILNYLRCEAHRDKQVLVLQQILNNK